MQKIIQEPKNYNGIFVVGEAPGADEDRIKAPFVGAEGQYLRDRFRRCGIDPKSCFITNTVHRRPIKNAYSSLKKEDIDEGREELIKDILKWEPNVILAVGAKALEMLTDKEGIFKYRGSVMPCSLVEGYKVFPTVHPGNIFRGNNRFDIVFQIDLKNALIESSNRTIYYPERNIEVVRSLNPAIKLLNELSKSNTPQVIDIETAGGWMCVYGIAVSPTEAYVFPRELLVLPEIVQAISQYAASPVPKVFHNALFDVFHNAYYYGIRNENIYYDTMIAQHAAYPTLPKSLAFCASIYTREPYWKDEGKEIIKDLQKNRIIDWEAFNVYNGKDCCLTYEIMPKIQEEIDYWGTQDTFDLMMSCVRPAIFAVLKGFRVNQDKVDEFKQQNEKSIETLERIKEEVIGDLNVKSPKQLKEYLYTDLDLPQQRERGKVTTNTRALETLESYPTPHKAKIGLIREIKGYSKRREFYGYTKSNNFEGIKLDEDDRMRFSINLCGTYTGRWATGKCITGSGFNMLNQPKLVRMFYEADPDRIFIQMDLSNAEARVVAALCGDEKWLRDFDVRDQHTLVAAHLFGIPFEEVTKAQRNNVAKKVAHATHYLLGWNLLKKLVKCSAKDAKMHKQNYYDLHPSLYDWHDKINTEVRKRRYIKTCFGRIIQFFGPRFDDMVADAVAAEPQSTSSDYLITAIPETAALDDVWFHLQVYDSILVSVPDNLHFVEDAMMKMKQITEKEITVNGLPMIIPCDFEIGYNWKDLSEVKDLNNVKQVYESLTR